MKNQKGITLIALVITIIVLLILAGVSISMVIGENGVLNQADKATIETRKASAEEDLELAWASADAEYWAAWTDNSSVKRGDYFTEDKLDNYLVGKGDVKEVIDNGNGTYTIKYESVADENVYPIAVDANGNAKVNGDPVHISKFEEKPSTTWTKTSEGELVVGSTVKHIATEEEFYVIGFAGTNNETVKLLAKDNLKADGSEQDNAGGLNTCVFSAAGGFTADENLNNNSTVKADTTSAVYKAMKYGETLGVTTGRLMLKSEADELESANSDILYGKNGKSSGTYLNYWLGFANGEATVYIVVGNDGVLRTTIVYDNAYCGVRPVVEILSSDISQ